MQLFDCKSFCSIKRVKIGTTWKILRLFMHRKERTLTTINKKNWNGNALNLWWYSLRCYCTHPEREQEKKEERKKNQLGLWSEQKVSHEILILEFNLRFRCMERMKVHSCRDSRQTHTQHETKFGKNRLSASTDETLITIARAACYAKSCLFKFFLRCYSCCCCCCV